MKKCIYFTVLCVVINISTLFADNWEPYPFHSSLIYTTDYSYSYQVGFNPLTNFTSSTKGQFFRVRFDSVSYNNDGSRTYYSERFLRHKNLPCASDSFDISARSIDAYYFQEDHYTIKGDTVIFYYVVKEYQGGQTRIVHFLDVIFPLNLQEGNEFIQQISDKENIKTKCISRSISEVLGQQDSIATYVLNWGQAIDTIVLSKQFGFINFTPISGIREPDIYSHKPISTIRIILAGIKDQHKALGIQLPEEISEDQFLNLKVGDIIKWKNTSSFENYYHRRDSITSIERTSDSIIINYLETEINTVIPFIANDYKQTPYWTNRTMARRAYPLKILLDLFNAPTNDVLLLPIASYIAQYMEEEELKVYRDIYQKLFTKPILYGSDTAMTLALFFLGNPSLNIAKCNYEILATDRDTYQYYLDSKIGFRTEKYHLPISLKYYGSHLQFEYQDVIIEVVGYRTNGYEWGDLSMPDTLELQLPEILISVAESVNNNILSIFPNPARDYIFINSSLIDGAGMWQYQIYDILGNCVQSGVIESDKINISQLSSGFYTVRFFNGGKQVVEKMMKE